MRVGGSSLQTALQCTGLLIRARTILLVIPLAVVLAACSGSARPEMTVAPTLSGSASIPVVSHSAAPEPPPEASALTARPHMVAGPAPSTSATPRPYVRIVIFLEGLDSTLPHGVQPDEFDVLKNAVHSEDPSAIVLPYSYKGVDVERSGPNVTTKDYTACDTQQALVVSGTALLQEIQEYTRLYQNRNKGSDVRVALIGHSLGGLIALSGMKASNVDRIVTLDSPLMGISAGKAVLASSFVSCSNGVVLNQLSAIQHDSKRRRQLEADVSEFQTRGGHIATLGNKEDCLYHPLSCPELCVLTALIGCLPWTDDTRSQLIDGADASFLCNLPNAGWGHSAILSHSETISFVGSFVASSSGTSRIPC